MPWRAVLSACVLSSHPTTPVAPPAAAGDWQPGVGPLVLETVVSARWGAPLSGLVNLDHPDAASLEDVDTPIQLPVQLLTHPTHGTLVVDTGAPSDPDAIRGFILPRFLGGLETVESLAAILARQAAPPTGVLLTHLHLDHTLGLSDVPAGTPIYAGPGELDVRKLDHAVTRSTTTYALAGHDPLKTWDFSGAGQVAGLPALDLYGDGSLIVLHAPGHTPGSIAVLANTTAGPVLLTGDSCHTLWGWEHGVEPGTFTADHAENASSLAALRTFVADHPEVRVLVGHETDGVGTGVEHIAR